MQPTFSQISAPAEFMGSGPAAEFLGISRATLQRLERLGQGPKRIRLMRRILYSRDSLRAFMEQRIEN